jgi:tRNA(adenine34) deaminase
VESVFFTNNDERFMRAAIREAQIAEEKGDVPIGCVIVYNGVIIAKGHNQREQLTDPTAHAEMIAITQAAEYLQSWRLHGCTIYVTLEPCTMCSGAMVLARIDRLVFGCRDPKTGACGSLYNIVRDERLNHRVEITESVLENECSAMLSEFFARRRLENKSQ